MTATESGKDKTLLPLSSREIFPFVPKILPVTWAIILGATGFGVKIRTIKNKIQYTESQAEPATFTSFLY